MHSGSCLCGTVKYEVRGEIGPAYYCHCSRCRKANGSAFAANAMVAAADFVVVQGQDAIRRFSTAEGVHREFCGHCGSPIVSRRDTRPEMVGLRLGLLDTLLEQGPGAHIFVASKAEWYPICDDLPRFEERPA